jgi:glycosyltransferase involved in cell wall biosynthesis
MKDKKIRKKLLVFHPALAPYRIDLFNKLSEAFDANIFFFRKKVISQNFDTNKIESQLKFKPQFLTIGFNFKHKSRMIRFGYLLKIIGHKPDIILCSEFNLMTFFSAAFAKIFFPKTEVYTLCDDSVDVAQNSSIFRRIGRYLCLKLLKGIILGNDFAEVWYNINYPEVQTVIFPIIQKEERIQSIINKGQQFSTQYLEKYKLENKSILLFVGRLVKVKNLNFLIEVFSQYLLNNKNVVLILIGDGDKKSELKELVSKLKIQDNIIFAGRFENEELYAWYRIADYFILPSTSETFGAVVNESLIAGVPVICSNLAGACCLINDENGKTFNPNNKEELLSIFNEVLIKKRENRMNSIVDDKSLMPFTFDQRMLELISFLKH